MSDILTPLFAQYSLAVPPPSFLLLCTFLEMFPTKKIEYQRMYARDFAEEFPVQISPQPSLENHSLTVISLKKD